MTLYQRIADRSDRTALAVDAATILAVSILLALSAKISVPFYPVPLTMQTLVVIGVGLALGPVRAGAVILLYLAEGAVGLPVFAGTPEKGIGLAYLAGPTGGYLIGYLPATIMAGWFGQRGWDRHPVRAIIAALLSSAVLYVPGLLWLGTVIGFDKPVLALGLYPFVYGDVVKAAIAALAFPAAWRWLDGRSPR